MNKRGGRGRKGSRDPARSARILELRTQGMTASQIAAEIGNGMTRSAVLGDIHRHGGKLAEMTKTVQGRQGQVYTTAPRATEHKNADSSIKMPEIASAPPRPREGCRWINGDPVFDRDWSFCNAPVSAPGSSWCAAHRKRCYTKHFAKVDAA